MNATSTESNDPWVESGAMVYVALTVATFSAVIMCCTWFVTHSSRVKRWRNGTNVYGVVSSGDDVELTPNEDEDDEEVIYEEASRAVAFTIHEITPHTKVTPETEFTLDGSSESESESEERVSESSESHEESREAV